MNLSTMDKTLLYYTVKKCDDNNKNKIEIYIPGNLLETQRDELIKRVYAQ